MDDEIVNEALKGEVHLDWDEDTEEIPADQITEVMLLGHMLKEARALRIPEGSGRVFGTKVAEKVVRWAEKRGTVTEADLHRKMADEIAKYNADLAYSYQYHGKII